MMKNFAIVAVFCISFAAYSRAEVTLTDKAKAAAEKVAKGDSSIAAFTLSADQTKLDVAVVGDKGVTKVADMPDVVANVPRPTYVLVAYDCAAELNTPDKKYDPPKPLNLICLFNQKENKGQDEIDVVQTALNSVVDINGQVVPAAGNISNDEVHFDTRCDEA